MLSFTFHLLKFNCGNVDLYQRLNGIIKTNWACVLRMWFSDNIPITLFKPRFWWPTTRSKHDYKLHKKHLRLKQKQLFWLWFLGKECVIKCLSFLSFCKVEIQELCLSKVNIEGQTCNSHSITATMKVWKVHWEKSPITACKAEVGELIQISIISTLILVLVLNRY